MSKKIGRLPSLDEIKGLIFDILEFNERGKFG